MFRFTDFELAQIWANIRSTSETYEKADAGYNRFEVAINAVETVLNKTRGGAKTAVSCDKGLFDENYATDVGISVSNKKFYLK